MNRTPVKAELLKMPSGYDFGTVIEAAQCLASHYAVVFTGFNEVTHRMEVLGSGTLVTVRGVKGILTADHVPELKIYGEGRTEFSICYRASGSKRPFNSVRTSQFLPIVVGKYSKAHEEEGPDLTLMSIIDNTLVESLGGIKSFYPLDDQTDISTFPITKLPWTISGSPHCFTRYETTEDQMELMRVSDFHTPACLLSSEERNEFDYLTLHVNAGAESPEDYGGLSGGGIWLVAMIDRDGAPVPVPLLQGVSYYATTPENGKCTLTGHGPNSIYKRLPEKVIGK